MNAAAQCTFNKHDNICCVHITVHQNAGDKSIRNKFEGQAVEDWTDGTKTITNGYHYFMYLPCYYLINYGEKYGTNTPPMTI